MLTSLYYYEHYRPYIMKSASPGGIKSDASRRRAAETEKVDAPAEVALNKSLNSDIVNYAKDIYRSTTSLKYTSKKLSADLRNYAKYKEHEEFNQSSFEERFQQDLEQFTDSYNKSVKFLNSQPHSPYLGDAANKLSTIASRSKKILSVVGISKNEDNELEIDRENNTFWDGVDIEKKSEAAANLFSRVHDEANEILSSPMSKHMNFKSLNYYYNYEVDKVHVDSFQIIKTGLLVNLAL